VSTNQRVIAEVTDLDAIQTKLAHIKQGARPAVVRSQKPGQGPQNHLFTAL
jgi:hypothetical protein